MQEQHKAHLHATSIAWQGRGALLLGPSGSGKSSVALRMLALGCDLIADDQTEVNVTPKGLILSCPRAIRGQIEARNFGILHCQTVAKASLICVVDLAVQETKRLPQEHSKQICGHTIRLFHNCGIETLPFALLQYLKSYASEGAQGRCEANET